MRKERVRKDRLAMLQPTPFLPASNALPPTPLPLASNAPTYSPPLRVPPPLPSASNALPPTPLPLASNARYILFAYNNMYLQQ